MQLGRTVHTIVGVMPEGFAFPLANDLWIPLRWNPVAHELLDASSEGFAFGKLAPGVTRAAAQAEVTAIANRRAATFPDTHGNLRALVMHYTDTHTGNEGVPAWASLAVYVFVALMTLLLLVPLVNVAILVYARTATRASEIAVRNALGASRRRLVTQLFVEGLVLAGLAAAAGLTLALFGLDRAYDVAAEAFGGRPFWVRSGRNPLTISYAVVLTLLAAAVAGILPGLKATSRAAQSTISRLGSGNAMRLGRTWTALIIVQVGITVAAIPPATSLAWQAVGEGVEEPTYETDALLYASLSHGAGGVGDPEAARREVGLAIEPNLLDEVVRRAEAEPGVIGVTVASALPGSDGGATVEIEGVPAPLTADGHAVRVMSVADDFFEMLDVSISEGRPFDGRDLEADTPPVVVNRTFVRRLLGEANAVGRRLRYVYERDSEPGPWREIVGVVEDLVHNPANPTVARPRIFAPLPDRSSLRDFPRSRAQLVLRLGTAPAAFAPRLNQITVSVDPTLRLRNVESPSERDDPISYAMRMMALGIAIGILSVLMLSTAGIYSLMSFAVTQRRREIGIRSALGAHPRRVLTSIFGRAAAELGVGIGAGLLGATFLEGTFVDAVAIGTRPEGVLLPAVAALLVVVGLSAVVGPARRGLRIQPTEALRES